MRALLAALLLAAAAAVAAVPSASASPGLRVCAPSNVDPVACVYGRGPDCLLIVINPPGPYWCTAPQQTPDVIVCQSYDCTSVRTLTDGAAVCVPPGSLSGACAGDVDQGICAWYWLGPNFTSVCVPDWLSVQACSNHLWDNDPNAGTECQDVP